MASETDSSAPVSNLKKKIFKISILVAAVLLVIFAVMFYFKYYYTYSDGYRTGLLQKFSHKGNMFKTYEGELWQNTMSANLNVAISTEKLFFSVTDKKVAGKLDMLQGKIITVHYHQKNNPIFWRGESAYIVDEVKDK
jgi:hypothetical protein